MLFFVLCLIEKMCVLAAENDAIFLQLHLERLDLPLGGELQRPGRASDEHKS